MLMAFNKFKINIMSKYFVNRNAQSNGDHEVHKAGCNYMPLPGNYIDLGYHSNCKDAVREARKYFTQVDGCYYCCNECHHH